jgi:membrane peptidoglycan carboxypeptidase
MLIGPCCSRGPPGRVMSKLLEPQRHPLRRLHLETARSTALIRHRRRGRKRHQRRQAGKHLAVAAASLIAIVTGVIAGAGAAETAGTPSIRQLTTSYLDQDTLIFDRHGALLADIGRSGDHRIVVPLSAISASAIEATIAIEDRSFYRNAGIDPVGMLRAALSDVGHQRLQQGGSTITQQLAKVALIGSADGNRVRRKFKEIALALELSQTYSKAQILEWYLNSIYYGNQSYGIEAAARSYFHTTAKALTLAQAALLAGLPQAPSEYNPATHPTAAKQRQAQVLAAMVELHQVTPTDAKQAGTVRIAPFAPSTTYEASAFVSYVLDWLAKSGLRSVRNARGLRIYTSLDLSAQRYAETTIRNQIAQKGTYYNFHDAALVSIAPQTGEILAMVGGNDPHVAGGQINMANSPRQPGSSFKIFTYTAAIESRRVNMESPILDAPLIFPVFGGSDGLAPYVPSNYDGVFHGIVPLKMAMGNSLNIPALKVELRIGIPAVVDTARRMGVGSLTQPDDSYSLGLTLGAYGVTVVDMATGASTLATLGVRHAPAPVLKVLDGLGRDVYRYQLEKNAFRAVQPDVAFIVASIMSDDRNRCLEFGCGGDLTLPGRHVAAKTGTTQVFRDNWTVGFTPTLATAVWVGNPGNQPLAHNSTGIVGAAPIWHQFMAGMLADQPDMWYQPPADVAQIGDDYFLPDTQVLSPILARPWPICPFGSYNPYALTYAALLVDGVPCTLAGGPPQRTRWHR